MNWTNVDVSLGDLKPWDRNPKRISKGHATRLLRLWNDFGQFQNVAIGPGGEVYDGHQRLSVLMAAYGPDYRIAARRSDRELTDAERERLTVEASVGTIGQFNWEELSGWNNDSLQGWGMDSEMLHEWNEGASALRELLNMELPETTPEQAWQGMPEYQAAGDSIPHRTIAIHFRNQQDVDDFASRLNLIITEATRSSWYPAREDVRNLDFVVVDGES